MRLYRWTPEVTPNHLHRTEGGSKGMGSSQWARATGSQVEESSNSATRQGKGPGLWPCPEAGADTRLQAEPWGSSFQAWEAGTAVERGPATTTLAAEPPEVQHTSDLSMTGLQQSPKRLSLPRTAALWPRPQEKLGGGRRWECGQNVFPSLLFTSPTRCSWPAKQPAENTVMSFSQIILNDSHAVHGGKSCIENPAKA